MNVPAPWRPLKIEGNCSGGTMILGRGADVVMQLKWWRPKRKRFRPDRWLRRRLKSMKARTDDDAACPSPDGFEPVTLATTRGRKRGKIGPFVLWYGWARDAGVQIEAVVGPQESGGRRGPWRALESLCAAKTGEPTTWAVFDSVFHVPPDFVIDKHELLLGDLSLRFTGPDRQALMLRQIYPAELALQRREMVDWLEFSRFRTRRHFRGATDEKWAIERHGRRLEGKQRMGVKSYPFPLGVVRPLCSMGAVVRDAETGRLLVAEHDSARPCDDSLLRRMILAMNQPEEIA